MIWYYSSNCSSILHTAIIRTAFDLSTVGWIEHANIWFYPYWVIVLLSLDLKGRLSLLEQAIYWKSILNCFSSTISSHMNKFFVTWFWNSNNYCWGENVISWFNVWKVICSLYRTTTKTSSSSSFIAFITKKYWSGFYKYLQCYSRK